MDEFKKKSIPIPKGFCLLDPAKYIHSIRFYQELAGDEHRINLLQYS